MKKYLDWFVLAILSFTLVGFTVVAKAQEESVPQPNPFPPLLSPFLPSPELRESFTILNTHSVSTKIYRGMEPREKIAELPANGITDLLVFKPIGNGTEKETREFKESMRAVGLRDVRVFDMPWKDIEEPYSACAYTIRALKYMKEVEESPNRKMFAHCTVGEDRTGMLMGLFRMLKDNWSKQQAFHDEMCRWGYERGDPNKPFKKVVCPIRDGLTPLYMRMARAIEKKRLTWEKLSNPKIESKICWGINDLTPKAEDLKCEISQEELDPAQVKEPEKEESCSSSESQQKQYPYWLHQAIH